MINKKRREHRFYGTATLSEKGQIVIPAQAREALKVGKGEKLLVFGMGEDMIAIAKLSKLEQFAAHLSDKLKIIQNAIKKNHKNSL